MFELTIALIAFVGVPAFLFVASLIIIWLHGKDNR